MTPQPATTPAFNPAVYGPGYQIDPNNPSQVIQQPTGQVDPWAGISAPPAAAGAPKQPAGDPWAGIATDTAPAPKTPAREVGTGEALGKGITEGASFGFAPAVAGLAAAAGPEYQIDDPYRPGEKASSAAAPVVGAAKLLSGYFSDHPDPDVKDAYSRGRQAALDDQNLAKEQHPMVYLAGQLAGAAAVPLPGAAAMRAGTVGARILGGVRAGAVGGGLYGAGEATSEGQSAGDVLKNAGAGAVVGAGLGGAIGGVAGPRAIAGTTPGQQAARTAEIIGAPIPKGVASDSRAIRSATSATASVPLMGARVRNALDATREAAGGVVGQSGVDDAIAANRARIDGLYNGVRGQIDPDRVMPMPRTAVALNRVRAPRQAARQPNPDQGLEQFDNIATQGASFNGAHRARVDAREAGNVVNPHPGYNAADYNAITRAMTADIRAGVQGQGGNRALTAFDRAEQQFGPISEANRFLARIAQARGPGAGLDELGYNPATGEFSLDKFVTAWNKLNPQSRPFAPTPQHRDAIEAIFQMGTHIKSSMRERNTSHTSTPLIMMDLARDAILGGVAVGTGTVAAGSVAGGAVMAAPAIMFAHWLSSPAVASSMSAWARAYRVATLGVPTPARLAAFNVATKNLANNIHVPVDQIIGTVQRRLAAPADQDEQQ